MKFLFDLFPVILFFGVFQWGEKHLSAAQALGSKYLGGIVAGGSINTTLAPVLLATAVAILGCFFQITYLSMRRKKIDGMLWLSFGIICVFGGATIYFQNPTFIKWKPTILYWCFAASLWISQFFYKKELIRTMMENLIALPDHLWHRLNLVWTVFFTAMGLLNLYVAFNFSLSTWVTFKLFGATSLSFIFFLSHVPFFLKYARELEPK